MTLKSQNLLIMLVIVLVCSITPISAEQIGDRNNIQNISDDINLNTAIQDGLDKFICIIGNAENTELTDEQGDYLDTRLDDLQSKSYSILDNLEGALDYLIILDSKYNKNLTNSSNKIKLIKDIYSNDLINIAKHLNSSYDASIVQKEYYDGCNYVNGSMQNGTNFILQIKWEGYIRYVDVVNINENNITFVSPNNHVHSYNSSGFKSKLMTGDTLNMISILPVKTLLVR